MSGNTISKNVAAYAEKALKASGKTEVNDLVYSSKLFIFPHEEFSGLHHPNRSATAESIVTARASLKNNCGN